jgi:hypothetical protein
MDKPGFRPLIRCASKIFDAPVVFTDNKYQLISLYPTKKIGDFVYDTLLTTGGLPDETIAAYHDAYLKKPGTRYEPFFEKEGLVEKCPRIFAEVYDEAKVLGHIAIFLKDKTFEPWQLEAASFLTSVIRSKMNLSNQALAMQSDTLHYLLNRNSTKQAKERAIFQLSQGRTFPAILLVAPLNQTKSQHAFASVAINYCLHKFPGSLPTVYNDDLVVLVAGKKKLEEVAEEAEKISNYLKQYQLLCGAVIPVTDLYSLPEYHLQGRLTAVFRYMEEVRNNSLNTPLYYYHEFAPGPLFLHLSQNPEYRCFVHPVLEKIKSHDGEYGTDFYATLEVYCKNLFEKNETSEYLHIHRNTLNYRLGRIEEIFGLDLKNPRILTHLLISFEMRKYQ